MSTLRAAFVGTGRSPERSGPMGYATAYWHADAYRLIGDIELVAAADIVEDHARIFANHYGFTDIFTDYREMLAAVKPDILSVCTWPHLHAEMIIAGAEAGVPFIYSEKPMAYKWGDCKAIMAAVEKSGTRLFFNHQRRYSRAFAGAKELLEAGAIGQLHTVEFGAGNLYDYGSHNFDMCNFYNDECDIDWVLCGLDYSRESLVFGTHNENSAVAVWHYTNGVMGLCTTGEPAATVGCHHRLQGSDGVIEIGRDGQPPLRLLSAGKPWQVIDTGGDGLHGTEFINRAIADAVAAYRAGRPCMMDAANAYRATETIFACWESARRRGIVRLPLDTDDNALVEMVKAGELRPVKGE